MDVVDHLYQRLAEAIARSRTAAGLTVGDLYQRLIPYRAVRGDLGIWELAQYEHALLRLLAGEGGYLRLENENAREVIAHELTTGNPILGIYRDYAALRVHLGGGDRAPAAAPPPARTPPPRPAPPPTPVSTPDARPAAPSVCRECHAPLPEEAESRSCPECGADRTPATCAACGTVLREEWNFCIRCGLRRTDRGGPSR